MIKIVRGRKDRIRVGYIYLPKEYVGRAISVVLLSKEETKAYRKKEKELQEQIDKSKRDYEEHLLKLRKLREERK